MLAGGKAVSKLLHACPACQPPRALALRAAQADHARSGGHACVKETLPQAHAPWCVRAWWHPWGERRRATLSRGSQPAGCGGRDEHACGSRSGAIVLGICNRLQQPRGKQSKKAKVERDDSESEDDEEEELEEGDEQPAVSGRTSRVSRLVRSALA